MVWGIADTHAHPVSHLGFGGNVIWGKPFDIGAVNTPDAEARMNSALGNSCERIHQLGPVSIHDVNGGYPNFTTWPTFYPMELHQQCYVDWIERAYRGGLRLMSALAITNQVLEDIVGGPETGAGRGGDMHSVRRQVQEMHRMIEYIDTREGGRGMGWMQIALNPSQARDIISSDKLAIILGIEVDSLFGWRTESELSREAGGNAVTARNIIRQRLGEIYGLGIRQITPIHFTNNAFGGCAVYNRFFDVVNYHVTGDHYEVTDGRISGVQYRMELDGIADGLPGNFARFLAYKLRPAIEFNPFDLNSWFALSTRIINERWFTTGNTEHPSWGGVRPGGGHVNVRGLTLFGIILLDEMMKLGMIIDIDHMSQKSANQALGLAEISNGYPILSSHTGFRALAVPSGQTSKETKKPTETQKTEDQIIRIRELGGMIAPILNQNDGDTYNQTEMPNEPYCADSSRSFAHAYLYAIRHMNGKGVAFGSDVNSFVGLTGPRFGTKAANSLSHDDIRRDLRRHQAGEQTNGVRYQSHQQSFRTYHTSRFGITEGLYDRDEDKADIWVAISLARSNDNIDTARIDVDLIRRISNADFFDSIRNKIKHFARGIRAQRANELLEVRALDIGGETIYDPKQGDSPWEERAAFIVSHPSSPPPDRSDHPRVQDLISQIRPIWNKWHQMEGANAPLVKNFSGTRDFDINLDGFAHYGMLPDFLQDLKNIGLTDDDLRPLFRSAEDYIQMWEKCVLKSQSVEIRDRSLDLLTRYHDSLH